MRERNVCRGIALLPKNKCREKKRIQTKRPCRIINPHQAEILTGPDKLSDRFNSFDKTKRLFFLTYFSDLGSFGLACNLQS